MSNNQLDFLLKRLKQEEGYETERLKNLFSVAYKNPLKAFNKYSQMLETKNVEQVVAGVLAKPQILGQLKGNLMFGFKKSKERRDAEFVLGKIKYVGTKLEQASLQRKEAERRVTLATAKAKHSEESSTLRSSLKSNDSQNTGHSLKR